MKYKVFDSRTGKDITEQRKWVLYPDGNVSYVENGLLFYYPKDRVKVETDYSTKWLEGSVRNE